MARTGRGPRWPKGRACPRPRSGRSGRLSSSSPTGSMGVDGFKLSTDPLFVPMSEKVYDVVQGGSCAASGITVERG